MTKQSEVEKAIGVHVMMIPVPYPHERDFNLWCVKSGLNHSRANSNWFMFYDLMHAAMAVAWLQGRKANVYAVY